MTVKAVPHPRLRAEVDSRMVDACKELVRVAKRGELQALGIVTVKPGRLVGTAYYVTATSMTSHELLSGCAMLQHRVVSHMDGE